MSFHYKCTFCSVYRQNEYWSQCCFRYILALCEVIDESAGLPPHGHDIVEMLTTVNDRIARTTGLTADKQMSCIWHYSLRKKFYFDVPIPLSTLQ